MPPNSNVRALPSGQPAQDIGGAGGGDGDDVKERVVRLETHFEYIRADLDEIKRVVSMLPATLSELPTKKDLWAWKIQWTAISLAAVALIIGGVIGGLAWIKPEPTPPTPIVIQTGPLAPGTSTVSPERPE